MAYSEKVLDHYENPRNVGSFEKGDDEVGTGMVGAPACGDVMKLQIKVDENGVITESKFKTFGCGSAIASSSVACAACISRCCSSSADRAASSCRCSARRKGGTCAPRSSSAMGRSS